MPVATTQEDRTYPPVGVYRTRNDPPVGVYRTRNDPLVGIYRTGNDPLGRVGDRLLARAAHRCMTG